MYPLDKTRLFQIRKTIEEHHKNVVEQFHKKHAETLKFAKKHSLSIAGAAIVTAAAIGGHHVYAVETAKHKQEQVDASLKEFVGQIGTLVKDTEEINRKQETIIAQALSKNFDLNLKPTLDGHHLNEIFGYVGAEQHLRRWDGDNLAHHGLKNSGMAPLQGSFKDFDNAEQEKYYVAVQLHELPGWDENWSKLKPWYRYRKVFVFNPANQRGIVAVIGDSGPSKFTGKTFGGSPELMQYLQMKDGKQKGKAIILFVDDPENKIVLGPVGEEAPKFLSNK